MVTGLLDYHPVIPCLLETTHKQVYYAGCKKQCEDIIIDIITGNLQEILHFTPFSLKKLSQYTQFQMLLSHKRFSDQIRQ